jgi:hypothetical protein
VICLLLWASAACSWVCVHKRKNRRGGDAGSNTAAGGCLWLPGALR